MSPPQGENSRPIINFHASDQTVESIKANHQKFEHVQSEEH